MNDPLVEFLIEGEAWVEVLQDLDAVAEAAAFAALEEAGLPRQRYAISLLACDDARIAQLNKSFRGKETPTNVLSWPVFELQPEAPGALPPRPPVPDGDNRILLGDVAIALQTCQREAAATSKPLKNHVTHLILHGCLHLLGYDHGTDADAALMEGKERRALARLGIPDPYV